MCAVCKICSIGAQSDRRTAVGTSARHRRAPAARAAAAARIRRRAALSRARARHPPAARLLFALWHTLSSRNSSVLFSTTRSLQSIAISYFHCFPIDQRRAQTNRSQTRAQVHLRDGVRLDAEQVNETCTAGAGSLLIEFGLLSRLLRDPTYEAAAARVVRRLLQIRSNATGVRLMYCIFLNMSTSICTGDAIATLLYSLLFLCICRPSGQYARCTYRPVGWQNERRGRRYRQLLRIPLEGFSFFPFIIRISI